MRFQRASVLLLCLACSTLLLAGIGSADLRVKPKLLKDLGTPKSYDWESAKANAKDPLMNPIFDVLNKYSIPSAAIAYQLNPTPTGVQYVPPTTWRNPQAWWMAGYGVDYKAPMRISGLTMPIIFALYENQLQSYYNHKFYDLWTTYVGPLPEPKDTRIHAITIKHLLDGKSGFDNGKIGFDPAFKGFTVDNQIAGILRTTILLDTPGNTYSNSNFGYLILGRLAEAITKRPLINQVRQLFKQVDAPVFDGKDYDAISYGIDFGTTAAEPSIYYRQKPDKDFWISTMKGDANLVTNVAALSWFGTQYRLGGSNAGKQFAVAPAPKRPVGSFTWVANGSMPGSMALLAQWTTPKGRVAAISILINTRVPKHAEFFMNLNRASLNMLNKKFAAL